MPGAQSRKSKAKKEQDGASAPAPAVSEPTTATITTAATTGGAASVTSSKKEKRGRAPPPSVSTSDYSWWSRVKAFIMDKDDFSNFGSPHDAGGYRVTQRQLAWVRRVQKLRLPPALQQTVFDTVDFFSRRRVIVVMLLLAMLVAATVHSGAFDEVTSTFIADEPERPGLVFFDKYNGGSRELPYRRPVVIIPGFITGALELWEANSTCLRRYGTSSLFRSRMFGPQMIYLILRDTQCWTELFSMDLKTGLDKPGIKVRADSGFASVDYFIPGYWVWAKVLVNLADIGYDPQSMAVATYDWRLSPEKAQERDGFFYNLRSTIKFFVQKNRRRAVVISHSYGATVALTFFKWAEQRDPGYMDRYVAYYVNVGGTTFGAVKAVSGTLMGDVRDTITIPTPARSMLDSFLSQSKRYEFTRAFPCAVAMLPHGCPEALPNLFVFENGTGLDMAGILRLTEVECTRTGHESCARDARARLETVEELPVLPQAPRTTAVCLYGVGRESEVGFHIKDNAPGEVGLAVNTSHNDETTNMGVRLGDGDSTVPLLSLGYMCRAPNGWKQNVGRVVTVEYRRGTENKAPQDLRGGGVSGDHVDILGNYDLLETILKIASGMDDIGADATQDEVEYFNPRLNATEVLHRRVVDEMHSNIDERIQSEMPKCLSKPNIPIAPLPPNFDTPERFD